MTATIQVQNLTKTFKLSKKQMKINHTKNPLKVAVDEVSFETFSGEIFGLLGPNGAGKTTALRCIATMIKPDKGTITIAGIPIENEIEIKKNIAFLTNELKLEEQFTPNYMFAYFSRLHDVSEEIAMKRKESLFKRFSIDDFSEVKIGELSTGMRQKVSIVVSLVHDPDIIIFDEPTNGLDVITAKTVTDYLLELKEKGKTIIISTHIMNLVEKICDRVGIIFEGKMVICDTLKNIQLQPDTTNLEDLFFKLYKKSGGEEL